MYLLFLLIPSLLVLGYESLNDVLSLLKLSLYCYFFKRLAYPLNDLSDKTKSRKCRESATYDESKNCEYDMLG